MKLLEKILIFLVATIYVVYHLNGIAGSGFRVGRSLWIPAVAPDVDNTTRLVLLAGVAMFAFIIVSLFLCCAFMLFKAARAIVRDEEIRF